MSSLDEVDQFLDEAEAFHLYASGDAAHDFDHVLRVTRLAQNLAEAEGADSVTVRLAALLHDVPVTETRGAHHLSAAAYARQLLSERGLDTARLDNVIHAIEAHRFRDQSIQPNSLEAKCLYDADKLDSMGAIGIARVFAYAGAHGARLWTEPYTDAPAYNDRPVGSDYTPVHEYVYKLSRLWETLHTETAKRIGQDRHAAMAHFFDRLDQEMIALD